MLLDMLRRRALLAVSNAQEIRLEKLLDDRILFPELAAPPDEPVAVDGGASFPVHVEARHTDLLKGGLERAWMSERGGE